MQNSILTEMNCDHQPNGQLYLRDVEQVPEGVDGLLGFVVGSRAGTDDCVRQVRDSLLQADVAAAINSFMHSSACLSCSLLVIDEHAEFVSSLAVIATLLVEFPEQVLESLPSAAVDLVLQELLDVRRFALKMLK